MTLLHYGTLGTFGICGTTKTNITMKPDVKQLMETKPFHLIETFSGKTIARAASLEELGNEIQEKLTEYYSIHHETEGWFAPASILFKKEHLVAS